MFGVRWRDPGRDQRGSDGLERRVPYHDAKRADAAARCDAPSAAADSPYSVAVDRDSVRSGAISACSAVNRRPGAAPVLPVADANLGSGGNAAASGSCCASSAGSVRASSVSSRDTCHRSLSLECRHPGVDTGSR